MITITKIIEFEAAHYLPGHSGKCGHMHGHSYRLEVTVAREPNTEDVQSNGMVMDFGDLKKIMTDIIDNGFDHCYINEWFPGPPTAENMICYIKELLMSRLPLKVAPVAIRLWETSTSYAEWRATC